MGLGGEGADFVLTGKGADFESTGKGTAIKSFCQESDRAVTDADDKGEGT